MPRKKFVEAPVDDPLEVELPDDAGPEESNQDIESQNENTAGQTQIRQGTRERSRQEGARTGCVEDEGSCQVSNVPSHRFPTLSPLYPQVCKSEYR